MSLIKPGSGLFSTRSGVAPHLIVGPGGIAKEVYDVRNDILATIGSLANLVVEEMAAPPAASNTALMTSTTTATTATVVTGAAFTGALGPGPVTPAYPRNVTVTATAGSSSYAGSVTVKGTSMHGLPQTETIVITASTTVAGKKAFATITEVDIPAQLNTSGAISLGTGAVLGLYNQPKGRTGATVTAITPFKELTDLAAPTAGTVDGTNSTYTPNTAPNGTHNYIVYFEAVGA